MTRRIKMKKEEIYWVNRKKAFIRRFFHKENVLLTPKFSLIRHFDDKGKTAGQHIRNRFSDRMEFFLFNMKKDIKLQFVVIDAHERLHRFISKELNDKFFKGEESIVRKICEYAFSIRYI